MFKWLFGGKGGGSGEARDQGNAEIVVVSRTVKATPDQAFATFVDKLAAWWPRDLTWAGEALDVIAIDPKINGKATERSRDGKLAVWGTVLSVQRPDHIVIAWQISANRSPEASEATASRVDVRFLPAAEGATEVVVVHRDFARHGEGWQAYRATMGSKTGWPRLMELYAKAVGG
jgi:uncharacterized protein YndB with AHSA1/START domain